ncbi:MAG TPA: GNAT family N-acetyltransferase [Gaiellaceae bacterium]|nr:GNAT family N-acetyltransferase [Gaiellaceae bacterium]
MKIVPFGEEHVDAAAEVLAERHERHRRAEPLLPGDVDFRAKIAGLLAGGATGAFADAAFVLGKSGPAEHWGPNISVDSAGHAARDPELLRDVWAAAAASWFEQGLTEHYALVPATDEPLVDAWFRVGFGAQHAHAVIEVPEREWPAGVREATEDDVEALVAIGPVLSRQHRQSPVFSRLPEQTPDEIRSEVLDDFEHDRVVNLVFEAEGRIVGNFALCPVEMSEAHSGLARVPGATLLAFAVTDPELHGSGAGLALTDASFAWARAHGYETMVVDWRATNLLASRFWPRRGFRTSFVRVHRSISK